MTSEATGGCRFEAVLVLRGDGGEGAAVVAAVDELDGELEVLLALLRVRVQAHRPLLAKLQNGIHLEANPRFLGGLRSNEAGASRASVI